MNRYIVTFRTSAVCEAKKVIEANNEDEAEDKIMDSGEFYEGLDFNPTEINWANTYLVDIKKTNKKGLIIFSEDK
tara:strand:- start:255 stop:479 length:225 start_codon:yes stop_codon:yes gene_type:complete